MEKLIFVGPPGVGKTTLRKVFFEFESAEELLEFALDPTYGIESIVLNFGQKIGVFDLSGQENDKWLDTEEKEVFYGSTYILCVVDVNMSSSEMVQFANKVCDLRREICPDSMIYFLVHKIDLISRDELKNLKERLVHDLDERNKFKMEFTSIKRRYFLHTLIIFREIIKAALNDEIPYEKLDYGFIRAIIAFLNQFKNADKLSYLFIKENLLFSESRIQEIIQFLKLKNFLKISGNGDDMLLELTIHNKGDFLEQINRYSNERLVELEKKYFKKMGLPEIDAPPFIGMILADDIGRALSVVETSKGAFNRYLNVNMQVELDLIAPFLSALEHFSKELNLVDMTDFNVLGNNTSMYVTRIKGYQVTFFLNPGVNVKGLRKDIFNDIGALIEKYNDGLQKAVNEGSVSELQDFNKELQSWLHQINDDYSTKIENYEILDLNSAKRLYEMLDELSDNIESKLKSFLESTRDLKKQLVNAILSEDLDECKVINNSFLALKKKIESF
ncbi:MAG: hypothetical protein ACTSVI_12320 [Promethearchaeota archaeon]